MTIVVGLAGWYLLGLAGSALSLEFCFRRGSWPMPITVGDIVFGAFMALTGPISLVVGMLFFIGWAMKAVGNRVGVNFDTTVFPARRR
jgi:hypothetical protein